MTVEPWGPEHESAIAAFVSAHPEGLIYYSPAFRRYLQAVAGGECRSRVALEDGRVAGVMPVLVKDGPFGAVLNSLPFFGSNGGVLAASAAAESALLAEYDRMAAAVSVATWISHPFMDTASPRHDLTDERIAQWTALAGPSPGGAGSSAPADDLPPRGAGPSGPADDLPPRGAGPSGPADDLPPRGAGPSGPADDLPPGVEASARRNVQKARSAGVTVREAAEAVPFLEATHRENMAAIGGRAKPVEFFARLDTMTFGRDWRLHLAEKAGEPLAALLTFEAAKTVEYVMPVVVESARTLQPTALILAVAMADAARRGFTRWNWGGTWLTQEGVYRFKKKWGAAERRYRYFITLNDPSLRTRSAADLSSAYPWYFTLPYGQLAPSEPTTNGH